MSGLSKINVMVRRFPSLPPVGTTMSRTAGRSCVAGSPYLPLDPLAKWMMWLSTLAVVVMVVVLKGVGSLPCLAVGVPGALATGVMIARMGGRDFSRAAALVYFVGAMAVISLLP